MWRCVFGVPPLPVVCWLRFGRLGLRGLFVWGWWGVLVGLVRVVGVSGLDWILVRGRGLWGGGGG